MKLVVEIELKGELSYRCLVSSTFIAQHTIGVNGETMVCANIPSLRKAKTLLEIADKVKEDVTAYVDGVNSANMQTSSE